MIVCSSFPCDNSLHFIPTCYILSGGGSLSNHNGCPKDKVKKEIKIFNLQIYRCHYYPKTNIF